MRTFRSVALAAAWLALVPRTAPAQQRPRLQAIDGFMVQGVFTELDSEQMKHRLSLAEIEKSHFDGISTDIQEILTYMARSEKLRSRIAEPLEVRGQIPVTLPPNTTGNEAYTTCFYAFNFNGLVLAGSGDELILVRPESQRNLPKADRKWNREQVLPVRLFRLGYLKPDPILAQYRDKLGTREGRAILEAKSNVVIVGDKAASLEKLQAYIDAEVLGAMGVSVTARYTPGDALRPPSLGAIANRANVHFYLTTFARASRFAMSGAKTEGVAERYYPEADLWLADRGYRALAAEYKRINEFVQLAKDSNAPEWPTPDGERALSPADQKKLDIHFGVISLDPPPANTPKRKRR